MISSPFHTTRWTLVRRAQGQGEESRKALSELCSIYYEPVLQFTRHWCGDTDRAADLAHGFFEELLTRETPGLADPEKGRFRGYLLAAVKHWLSRQREREAAAKRGGGTEQVSLENAAEVPVEWEHDFDRAWALAVIRQAHEELRAEMEQSGKERQWTLLQPWLDGGAQGDASSAAEELGLSANALKVTIHRLRECFREKVRAGIAATLDDPRELAGEFRHLVEVLARSQRGR